MSHDQRLRFAISKGGDIATEVWKDCGNHESPIGMAVALGQATGTILSKLRDTLGPDVIHDFLTAVAAMISQVGQLEESGIGIAIVKKL